MAGHWSRLAMAPEMAQVMTAGSFRLMALDREHSVTFPRAVDVLGRRHLERAADGRPRLARVDDVVDHRVAGGHVDVDDLAKVLDQLLALGRGIVGALDLLAEDDLDRALGAH